MIQLPKHQIDGTNSGSRLKIGLTFGTLRKASWLVAKGLVIAEGPRTSRNLTGNALPVEVPCARAGSQWKIFSSAITHDQRPSVEQRGSTPVCRQHCSHSPQTARDDCKEQRSCLSEGDNVDHFSRRPRSLAFRTTSAGVLTAVCSQRSKS